MTHIKQWSASIAVALRRHIHLTVQGATHVEVEVTLTGAATPPLDDAALLPMDMSMRYRQDAPPCADPRRRSLDLVRASWRRRCGTAGWGGCP